jgi:hypothetical protein
MSTAKTALLEELEPLQTAIEQTQGKLRLLEGELRTIEAEIGLFSKDKQRFDSLRDVCNGLDAMGKLGASQLFWEGLLDGPYVDGHLQRLREHIAGFEEEIRGTQEKHGVIKEQINQQHHDLNFLHEEIRQAYAREERRNEEFLIEREVSPIPFRAMVMPWNTQDEGEKRYRLALLVALLLSIGLGSLIPLWKLPVPDRSAVIEVPERLAMLVKKEQAKPEPPPKRPKEEKKLAKDEKKSPEQPKEDRTKANTSKVASTPASTTPAETESARSKAESTGVLAFKESFSDLMDVTPVPKLGVESHLISQSGAAGQASRSLVAMQSAGVSSGGIGNAAVSRNIGGGGGTGSGTGSGGGRGSGSGSGTGNRLGGVGVARVESTVAGLAEAARPLSTGSGPARTDEEIQIVFDRYKATLYRIYNAELRKIPTLRGKMIMLITIEPGGEVSACTVLSTDLASPELVVQIVDRVKKFNFGPKEKVPTTSIKYPIDFLPAG